jgi:asparagine synthase (glutamine-hydrolysing)
MQNKEQYLLQELEAKIIDTVGSYIEQNVERPFGILLSGGYDSGLLAALTKPDFAYRVKFPYGTVFDESRYAEAIGTHLDIPITEVVITPENFKENFKEAVKVMGEPTTHFSLVPLYLLFKEMKDERILSGEGPDEYLSGYARQVILDEVAKLMKTPELRTYQPLLSKWLPWTTELVKGYGERMGYPMEKVERYAKMHEEGIYPLQGTVGKMDMELGIIEKMEGRMAKHFGVELHYPYISEDLAEYCYKLPDEMKIKDGKTKVAFKEIAMKYLPEIMRNRSKMGGPVAPANFLLGRNDLDPFDKSFYISEQKRILGIK